MFFDEVLVKNKVLRKVWRAAHGKFETSEDSDENSSLPVICENLERWIGSEDQNPRKRTSLRTSATLINGAAKLYKHELDQLMEDLAQLDEDMIGRNRRNPISFDDDSSDSLESCDTPEQMMRQSKRQSDKSIEIPQKVPAFTTSTPLLCYSLSNTSESTCSQLKRPGTDTNSYPLDISPKRQMTELSENSDKSSLEQFNCNSKTDLSEKSNSRSLNQLHYNSDVEEGFESFDRTSLNDQGDNSDSDLQSSDEATERISDHNPLRQHTDRSPDQYSTDTEIFEGRYPDRLIYLKRLSTISEHSSPTFTDKLNASLPNSGNIPATSPSVIKYTVASKKSFDDNKIPGGSDTTASSEKNFHNLRISIDDDISFDAERNSFRGRITTDSNSDSDRIITEKSSHGDRRTVDDQRKSDDDSITTESNSGGDRRTIDIMKTCGRITEEIRGRSVETDKSSDDRCSKEFSQRSVILVPKTRKKISKVARKKKSRNVIKKDAATQTVSFLSNMRNRDNNTNFDQNLPFGALLIYESYQSRIPTKIVFSSLRRQ